MKTALGGTGYVLPSFSTAVNLTTTGAGGMDTGSGLMSVWPTNGSSQFTVGTQVDRKISIGTGTVLSNTTTVASVTVQNISSIVPANARSVIGDWCVYPSGATQIVAYVFVSSAATGRQQIAMAGGSGGVNSSSYTLDLSVAQTLYYSSSNGGGTVSLQINGYAF